MGYAVIVRNMTYYEEFGISSTATSEQIRIAHRRLVKILHPDLQKDAVARQLAEIQTARVNGMAEVLLDPDLRLRYDRELVSPKGETLPPRQSYGTLILAGSALILFASFCALLGDRWSVTAQAPVNSPTASPVKAGANSQGRSAVKANVLMPDHGGAMLRASEPAARPQPRVPLTGIPIVDRPQILIIEPPQSPDLTVLPKPPAVPIASVTPKPPAAAAGGMENPLIGTWVYLPVPVPEEDHNMYRPEYIEMRIRSIRGLIEGQYRARYHVPDRPLSPSVGFHFAGQPGALTSAFHWNGSRGLAGQVELKLMTTNSLQVDWRVTELAESADLVAGSAVLTRVQ